MNIAQTKVKYVVNWTWFALIIYVEYDHSEMNFKNVKQV